MEFTFRRMWQISTILVIITTVSITCRGINNLREEAERKLSLDDSKKQERRQDRQEIKCAKVPERRHKRNTLNGKFDDQDDMDKIVGGSYTTHGEVPWIANLLINGHHVCSGAILSEFWILTAASCFDLPVKETIEVVVGDNNVFSPDEDEQKFTPTTLYLNTLYSAYTKANNLVLINVRSKNDTGIRFSDKVKPVCLHSIMMPPERSLVTIAGWGYDSFDVLKKITLPIEPMETCRTVFSKTSLDMNGTICVGRNGGTSALCLHDRGGPATFELFGYYFLLGMVSIPSTCIKPYFASLLTSILYQEKWIYDIIRMYSLDERERFLPTWEIPPDL